MAIANIRRALTYAEQDTGKIKGYKVYGRLSNYTLTGMQIEEKVQGGGIFALFFPKVFEHIDNQEYHKGMSDNVMETTGSLLIYIASEKDLGKDVCISLTKKTSLQRLYRNDNTSGCILSWNRKPHSDKWEIIPTKVVEIKGNKTAGNLSEYIYYDRQSKKVQYTKSQGISSADGIEWKQKGTKIVSSSPIRMPVERRTVEKRKWIDTTSDHPNATTDISHNLWVLSTYHKNATHRQGKFIKQIVAKCRSNKTISTQWTTEIIKSYLQGCFANWSSIGQTNLFQFLDDLDDLTTSETKKRNIRNCKYYLTKYMPELPDECMNMFFKNPITPNLATLATLTIAHVALIPLQRMYDCIKRISGYKGILSTEDGLYMALTDPFAMTLFGAGLRYEDCVKLQATIKATGSDCKDTKEMLYALSGYRTYTKDSNYRDMLITEEEWIRHEEITREDKIYVNKDGNIYFRNVNDTISGSNESYIPVIFAKEPVKNHFKPITIDNIPHMTYFKPVMWHIINKLTANGLVWKLNDKYIPTYESEMELGIAKRLWETRDRVQLVLSADREKAVGYVKKIATEDTTYIGENHIESSQLHYQHRPAYIEPIYLCRLRKAKKEDSAEEIKQHIIGDVSDYSLWELVSLMEKIPYRDTIIFTADTGCKPPAKGISIINFLKKVIPTKEITITEEEYKTSSLKYNLQLLSKNEEIVYQLQKGNDFAIRRLDKEGITKELSKVNWDTTRVLAVGEEYIKDLNEQIAQERNVNEQPMFYIHDEPFYQNDKIIYMGRDNEKQKRYELTKDENGKMLFKETYTTGIARKHSLELIGAMPTINIHYENKPKMRYARSETTIILGMHDSIQNKDVYILLDAKKDPNTNQLKGKMASCLKHGFVEDIHHMSCKRSGSVVIILNEKDRVCREDLYSAISLAKDSVRLIGDVNIQKSAMGISMETIYPKQRRTLFNLLVQGE